MQPQHTLVDAGTDAVFTQKNHQSEASFEVRRRMDLRDCEALMRTGSKSFFAASLVLPGRVRAPATALYAFCRLADDTIDLEIWRVPSPKMIMGGSREAKFDHPAQKPLLLSELPIANHTRAGDAVYDPFLGSGTTLIAAERLSRACLGMELDPRYVDVILLRWERFSGGTAERIDG